MLLDDASAQSGPITLAIDIGGSHLKAGRLAATGVLIGEAIRIDTPLPATPAPVLEALFGALTKLPPADRIAAGFPGVVRGGIVLTAPNLGTAAWHGYKLAETLSTRLNAPVRLLNDASVQGLGVIAGHGLECVITLGTGMGFALFQDGRLAPHLELSQHPIYKKRNYDDYIGNAERLRIGARHWNKRIARIIRVLRTLTTYDTLLIGGGNSKYIQQDLAPDVRLVSNQAGLTGGIRLWDPRMDDAFAESAPKLATTAKP